MTIRRALVVSIVLSLSLWGTSCGSEDDSTPDPSGSGGSHGDGSAGAVAPDTLEAFCGVLGAFFCDRCAGADPNCNSELATDCSENANARDPGGYSQAKGQACLDALAGVDCDALPLNCEDNLALSECNDYLDGQTNGIDPACP